MIKEVRIRSRKDMKQEAYIIDEPCIIISIRDILADRICFPVNDCIRGVLFEAFEDWDEPDDPLNITEEQAKEIVAFVNKWHNKPEEVLCYVNCEAGISRSAGVGAAIAKFFLGDDSWVFKTKHPNMLCYRRVLEALID